MREHPFRPFGSNIVRPLSRQGPPVLAKSEAIKCSAADIFAGSNCGSIGDRANDRRCYHAERKRLAKCASRHGRQVAVQKVVLVSTLMFHATAPTMMPLIGAKGANIANVVKGAVGLPGSRYCCAPKRCITLVVLQGGLNDLSPAGHHMLAREAAGRDCGGLAQALAKDLISK